MVDRKILLLTSDQREVDNLTPALDDLGYQWGHVAHADEIIPVLDDFQPDLVVLNALFPQVNISEMCAEIRDRTNAKILITSAISSATHQFQARHKWKVDEYVALPIPLKKMVRMVAFMLGDLDSKPTLRNLGEAAGSSSMPTIVEKRHL